MNKIRCEFTEALFTTGLLWRQSNGDYHTWRKGNEPYRHEYNIGQLHTMTVIYIYTFNTHITNREIDREKRQRERVYSEANHTISDWSKLAHWQVNRTHTFTQAD